MVTLVEEDHFVAGVELGHQQTDDGRHAGREQHGVFAPVERGELALDHSFARVAVAAVFFARQILLDVVDHRLRIAKRVRGRTHDRVGDGIGQLLALFAGVHGQRRRAAVAREMGFVISFRGGWRGCHVAKVLQ